MSGSSTRRLAEFLYRDGRSFYFHMDDGVFGFVSDCGLEPVAFEAVLREAMEDGRVPLEFLMRNTVMTARPKGFKTGAQLTESYVRLVEQPTTDDPEPSRGFLAGYRLGHARGYEEGIADSAGPTEEE